MWCVSCRHLGYALISLDGAYSVEDITTINIYRERAQHNTTIFNEMHRLEGAAGLTALVCEFFQLLHT